MERVHRKLNTKMLKFETPGKFRGFVLLKSKVLLSNDFFHTNFDSLKNLDYKFSFFDDWGLKLSHLDICDTPFHFWHLLSYSP